MRVTDTFDQSFRPNMKKFRENVSGIYKIRLRPNRELENVYRAYETSWETERLKSEENRQIYCELIEIDKNENSSKFRDKLEVKSAENQTTDGGDAQSVIKKRKWWTELNSTETNRPSPLKEIAVEQYARDFKDGSIDGNVFCQDAEDVGNFLDVNLPVLDLIDVENVTFWKRFVHAKTQDVLKLQQLSRDSGTDWKKIGIELSLEQFIENCEQADFDSAQTTEYLDKFALKFQSMVEDISIKKMKPRKSYEKNPLCPTSRVVNFSSNECFHGSLEFLSSFKRLRSLSITFDPGEVGLRYEKKLFQVAAVDIENIGKALDKLSRLESFEIHRSDLSEPIKIHLLLEPMKMISNLTRLALPYCAITSNESGESFANFLIACKSIKHLDLKGNNLGFCFCKQFAEGIRGFEGSLEFLDLSVNPIFGNGLVFILNSINEKGNVKTLNICSCALDSKFNKEICFKALVSLLQNSTTMLAINLNHNEMSSGGGNLIEALNDNFTIEQLDCEDCGFTTDESVKIKVLLLRNEYYRVNPLLKKETFTADDEREIEKFLTRTKHPMLLKCKTICQPYANSKKLWTFAPRTVEETKDNYNDFASV